MGSASTWLWSRWTSGGLALVGVLLVVPSVVAPTWAMSVSDRERGALLSRQWEWSWGRVRTTGVQGVELADVWDSLGLALLVTVLVLGLVAVAAWVLRGHTWGRVVCLVVAGVLTGRVLTTVVSRVGRSLGEVDHGASGLTVRTEMTGAGSLESAAALVLVVALVLMAATAIRAGRRSLGGEADPGEEDRAARVTRSVPMDDVGLRPVGEHLSGPAVGMVETDGERR